jgi:putative endonuclease
MPLLSISYASSAQLRAAAWKSAFAWLDRIRGEAKRPGRPAHLELGRVGEEAAFFHLRSAGFTVVAKGWTSGKAPGDLDLVAWEGDILCFVEVKTRAARGFAAAEAAVDGEKRRSLRRLAGHYQRQLPEGTLTRFDILSVYLDPRDPRKRPEFGLFRNAFGWKEDGFGD